MRCGKGERKIREIVVGIIMDAITFFYRVVRQENNIWNMVIWYGGIYNG